MASAPIPASRPSVPPTTAPVPAPAVAPSGALVPFSWANSLVPRFSGSNTEISSVRKPAPTRLSTPVSTCVLSRKMPNTAVFLPAIDFSSLKSCQSASGLDCDVVGHVSGASYFGCLLCNSFLLFSGANRALERYFSVLRDDLHVVCISGKRFFVHNRFSNFLHDLAIVQVVLALIGGRL